MLIPPLFALALALQSVPAQLANSVPKQSSTGQRKIPCKTPENAAMCYWAHGRLSYYIGNPPYRVWKIGTTRMVGIYSGPSIWPPKDQRDEDNPEFPANVRRVFDGPSTRIFADFEICP